MRDLTNRALSLIILSMSKRERIVGQAVRAELSGRRRASALSQRTVAQRGGVGNGIIGWIDGGDPGGLTVDTLVAYARGLGTEGWRVLRDVEEKLYGEP